MKHSDHVPIRTCISCGAKKSKGHLLRLVLDDQGRIIEDEAGRLPGRGAYVCRSGPCMEKLPKRRLDRALRVKEN